MNFEPKEAFPYEPPSEEIKKRYDEDGFVILKNAVSSAELNTIESELKEAQDKLIAGELGDRPRVFRDLAGLGHLALQFEPKALHLINGC